jgi:hypothetical protein
MGLREGGYVDRLLYSCPAQKIVLSLRVKRLPEHWLQRLYYRQPSELTYSEVEPAVEMESHEDALCPAGVPLVVFHTTTWRAFDYQGRTAWAGDSAGISAFNLVSGERCVLLANGSCRLPDPYNGSFVSRLCDVRPDASGAILKMGWHRPTPDGGYKVEYVFADVDFTGKGVMKIADVLEHTA